MNPCDLLSFVGSAAYFVLPDFNLLQHGMFGYYSGMLSHMCRFLSQKFIAIGGSGTEGFLGGFSTDNMNTDGTRYAYRWDGLARFPPNADSYPNDTYHYSMLFGLSAEAAEEFVDVSAANHEALLWMRVFNKVFEKAQPPTMVEYIVHWTEKFTPGERNAVFFE